MDPIEIKKYFDKFKHLLGRIQKISYIQDFDNSILLKKHQLQHALEYCTRRWISYLCCSEI